MKKSKDLDINAIVLSVFRKEYYNESIFEVMKKLKNKRVCYVTLNKPTEALQRAFKLTKASKNNVFFIDAVSKAIGKKATHDNAIFISSPAALTELSIAINSSLKSGVFDALLFDSLSTLKHYIKQNNAYQFTSSVINKLKSENRNGVFVCLEEDTETSLVRDSFMNVDQVVKLNDFYHKLERRKHTSTYGSVAALLALAAVPFLNFGANSGGMTGYVVKEGTKMSPSVFLIVIAVVIFIVSFVYKAAIMHRSSVVKPIDKIDTSGTIPVKDEKKLDKNFNDKIMGWFEKKHSI